MIWRRQPLRVTPCWPKGSVSRAAATDCWRSNSTGTPAAPVPAAPPGWMRRTLGALADLTGGARDGRLVVRAPVRGSDPAAVHVIARVVQHRLERPARGRRDRGGLRRRRWRPGPGRPLGLPPDVTPGNEGDARWLWLMVLALLGVEWWMRRSRGAAVEAHGADGRKRGTRCLRRASPTPRRFSARSSRSRAVSRPRRSPWRPSSRAPLPRRFSSD